MTSPPSFRGGREARCLWALQPGRWLCRPPGLHPTAGQPLLHAGQPSSEHRMLRAEKQTLWVPDSLKKYPSPISEWHGLLSLIIHRVSSGFIHWIVPDCVFIQIKAIEEYRLNLRRPWRTPTSRHHDWRMQTAPSNGLYLLSSYLSLLPDSSTRYGSVALTCQTPQCLFAWDSFPFLSHWCVRSKKASLGILAFLLQSSDSIPVVTSLCVISISVPPPQKKWCWFGFRIEFSDWTGVKPTMGSVNIITHLPGVHPSVGLISGTYFQSWAAARSSQKCHACLSVIVSSPSENRTPDWKTYRSVALSKLSKDVN